MEKRQMFGPAGDRTTSRPICRLVSIPTELPRHFVKYSGTTEYFRKRRGNYTDYSSVSIVTKLPALRPMNRVSLLPSVDTFSSHHFPATHGHSQCSYPMQTWDHCLRWPMRETDHNSIYCQRLRKNTNTRALH
jgi:hypothetical protein